MKLSDRIACVYYAPKFAHYAFYIATISQIFLPTMLIYVLPKYKLCRQFLQIMVKIDQEKPSIHF